MRKSKSLCVVSCACAMPMITLSRCVYFATDWFRPLFHCMYSRSVNNMKSLLLVAAVLAVLYAGGVESLPTGAPTGACTTLTPLLNPRGHADPPQTTTVPYWIDLSRFNNSGKWEYTPGETYTCKLM